MFSTALNKLGKLVTLSMPCRRLNYLQIRRCTGAVKRKRTKKLRIKGSKSFAPIILRYRKSLLALKVNRLKIAGHKVARSKEVICQKPLFSRHQQQGCQI